MTASSLALALAYAAAAGALAGLWVAHGWEWGLIYISAFLIVHLAFWLFRELAESEGGR